MLQCSMRSFWYSSIGQNIVGADSYCTVAINDINAMSTVPSTLDSRSQYLPVDSQRCLRHFYLV